MRGYPVLVLVLAAGVALGFAWPRPEARPLVHSVFFTLKEGGAANREKFSAIARKHLASTPNVSCFAVGPRAEEFKRELNDQEFDVALTLVFKDKPAHDTYQTSAAHQAFIAEALPLVKKVRVFDAWDQ